MGHVVLSFIFTRVIYIGEHTHRQGSSTEADMTTLFELKKKRGVYRCVCVCVCECPILIA